MNSIPAPKPAAGYFPTWLKSMPNTSVNKDGTIIGNAPKCIPFTDSFITGYIQELYCDVEVLYNGKDHNTGADVIAYNWAGSHRPINTRAEEKGMPNVFPKFQGFYDAEFHWMSQWEPQTPAGYSTMYHHPSNRFDLPFHTFTGIIDTDKWQVNGPVPFLIKEGFEGIIPAGTPIYQMTFIKRDEWNSSEGDFDAKSYGRMIHKASRRFNGGYKKEFWERKRYL